MLRSYRLIWAILLPAERKRFVALIVLTIAMALFEVVAVAGILPFLSVLADPGLIARQPLLTGFADLFGLETAREVQVALGITVFSVMLTGMVVRAGVTWVQIRFGLMRAYTISSRLLRAHLARDYVWHLSRNSAGMGQSLLSEVDVVIRESMLPAVLLISNLTVTLLIGLLLFVIQPWVAIFATGALLTVYLLVYMGLRGPLGRIGRRRIAADRRRFQVVQEIAGGLKEVKVMGLEERSLQRFRIPAQQMARHQTAGLVIARLPRFALEAVVYGGFITMVLVMLIRHGEDIAAMLPLFGLLGVAAARLFPALQQVYNDLSLLRFSYAALARLHDGLTGFAPPPAAPDAAPLPLCDRLELCEIRFRYPGAGRETLAGLSAVIPARSTVGVVGGTGAGKTTLIDLILGLLTPDAGEIRVDGVALTPDRLRGWQKRLGYVPQHIFLTDDTVAANIAFGAEGEIDRAAMERAATIANLHGFVTRELPQGYDTMVGERGIRLSGGQRQRIGIARALYHDPDVLILDEATSALDTLTEQAVMEAVHRLGRDKTVILIAHRLSTVARCDMILLLDQGRVAASGSYADLLAGNDTFRRMATA